ncbi:hypothetical protein ABZ960_11960 [Streptomyces pseudovenezuelae]|uniref:hypothetical protein n=1 Tax=Streptomyces pseudovenezuelae TaxID=67350 RepID=UPI0034A1C213
MRLRRIAMGGVVVGLVGVVVRAEGRAVGRVLLGLGDARVSGVPGATPRRARDAGARKRAAAANSVAEVAL